MNQDAEDHGAESRNLVTTFFTIPVGDGGAEPGAPPHSADVPRGDAAVLGLQWRVGAESSFWVDAPLHGDVGVRAIVVASDAWWQFKEKILALVLA